MKRIPLSGQHGIGREVLVDDEDYELVSRYKWSAKVTGPNMYAVASSRSGSRAANRHIRMHKLLTGWNETDHINGNGLDNRRANLRPATRSQNLMNRSALAKNKTGLKGVRFEAGRWRAVIKANGVRKHVGYFSTPELAARAYDAAAVEMHGEYARLNFPDDAQHAMPPKLPTTQKCARPDCDETFTPLRISKRYCSPACSHVMRQRRAA